MTVKPDCRIKRFCDLGILFLLGDGSFAREGGGCPPGVWKHGTSSRILPTFLTSTKNPKLFLLPGSGIFKLSTSAMIEPSAPGDRPRLLARIDVERWLDDVTKELKSTSSLMNHESMIGIFRSFQIFQDAKYDEGEDEVSGASCILLMSDLFLLGLSSSRSSGFKNETSFPCRMTFFCTQKTQLGSAHILY